MLIQVITHLPMQGFLELLEKQKENSILTTLQCCFSLAPENRPTQDEIVLLIKDIIGEYHSRIYMCPDGDIFIVWQGGSGKTINSVKQAVIKKYNPVFENVPEELFFRYFDFRAHGEELRIVCRKKHADEHNSSRGKTDTSELLKEIQARKENEDIAEAQKISTEKQDFVVRILDKKYIQVDNYFFSLLYAGFPLRKKRVKPRFLIIEDQAFAGRMLSRVIADVGEPFIASYGAEGLFMYAMYVPDIVFIDINLPDSTGHQLAEFIREVDPDAFIVMVTANHTNKDVDTALKNKVQAFMAKPYTLNKVQEVIGKFRRKKTSP